MKKISTLLFILLSFALIIGGVYYAIAKTNLTIADAVEFLSISKGVLAAFISLSLVLYALDSFRYTLVGKVLGVKISFLQGLELSIINFFFSWISPWGLLGPTATAYYLRKLQVPVSKGVVFSFAKSFTGVFLLLLVAIVAASLSSNNLASSPFVMSTIYSSIAFFTIFFGVSSFIAVKLEWINKVDTWATSLRDKSFLEKGLGVGLRSLSKLAAQIHEILQAGTKGLLLIVFSHLVYIFVLISALVFILFIIGGATDLNVISPAIVHLTLSYIAPTPNGAGISEMLIHQFFDPYMPYNRAVVAIIFFRSITFYLQIVIGLSYMLIRARSLLFPRGES